LQKIGLDPAKDVTLVTLGAVQNQLAALQSGAVKGGAFPPPEALVLDEQGFPTLVDLAAAKVPAPETCMIVTRAYLNTHRAIIQSYVDAIVEALAKAKQDKPFTLQVLNKYLKLTDEKVVSGTYDFYV